MENYEVEEIQEALQPLVDAITNIAHGQAGPDGLEGVAVALAGYGLKEPVGEAIISVASSIETVAWSIERLAMAIEKIHEKSREPAPEKEEQGDAKNV